MRARKSSSLDKVIRIQMRKRSWMDGYVDLDSTDITFSIVAFLIIFNDFTLSHSTLYVLLSCTLVDYASFDNCRVVSC